ncbi:hypothetical protein M9Y10_020704 [Tritrichomonas musculus]|uniref:Serine/threonine-protein phosphatase n=1 Tax=Tritrichomonas musculus TaxID=1915356 RepID=A0ABR2HFJ1_9EUKA
MKQISNPQISSFILHNYRHLLNGNNESIEKLGTEDLKIPKFNEEDLIDLCDSAIFTLKKINKTLLYIPSPSIVIGDLHGNLHDLIRLMNAIIDVFSNRVLFLGDYIDRGQFQLETITILLALRIEYPEHFFLIRGNHEFASVNAYGGFKDEILQSGYSEALYNKINETFSWLPIAAVINDHIFCVHGGLSPLFHEIKQIETEFKLPIVNIYTSSSNPYKKRNKLSGNSSSSRVANVSLRSSLNNVNATLSTNMSFFKADRKKPRFSDSSEFKTTAQNVKLGQEPNINSNIISHPPKFLPLCKKSNFEFPMNRKLPPLGTKSPLPSLPDVKPSISPSTNLNSELENSIASFPIAAPQNQSQHSQQASIISQMQNSAPNLSAATDQPQQQSPQQSVQTAISQNPNSIPPLPNSQNQTTNSPIPNSNSQNQNVNSPLLNSNSQNQNVNSPLLNSNSQNQNSILPLPSSLENSANSTSNSSLENENLVPSLCPKASSSPPLNMSAFYISSSQLEMMTKYKETVLKESEMNDDKNNTDLLTDLMWSDPTNSCELFLPSNRGSGCYFGYVITNHFLKKNGMKMIVRGHESVKRGIEKNHEKKVVTIYSSSSLRQGVLAGCAIFDTDDSFTEFRLIPISTVQRSEAKFFSPKAKQNNNNKPLKLNSFSRSQSIFGNVKKLRKNMKGSYHQSVNSSPDYNGNMIPDICTIKEEEGECL